LFLRLTERLPAQLQ